ncbi:GGDEF domain-containing protein [Alteromonas sp. ASW11-130]|uniref:GGDEF domain-containing protein n=1 Tax=Alteromonas sp. ASW11-130 TaxID=3015775 RepID=UPI002241E2CC|nr:GGDEF domain-containing protein [Alteromonas sp. ASW11-130]MCW8090839.1 GGDEF domain-containing protein [Alteromonas sp. ASW11-130]
MSKKRSNDEFIILVLSGSIALGILPFIIIRFLQNEWIMVLLNSSAFAGLSTIFAYVYFTGRTAIARWVIAFLAVVVMTFTIYLKGYQNILWVFPALTTLFFALTPLLALIIAIVFLSGITVILWPELDSVSTLQFFTATGSTTLFCFAFAYRMRQQQDELTIQATQDALTGVGNRRALEEKLIELIESIKRYPNLSSSVLLIDLDEFKSINDRFGHSFGDQVLKKFTQTIADRIRVTDKLYRYGGEEFVVVAENTSQEEAITLAESLRRAIEEVELKSECSLTASFGVAQYALDENQWHWLERADTALYKAKASGRNTTCAASDAPF